MVRLNRTVSTEHLRETRQPQKSREIKHALDLLPKSCLADELYLPHTLR